MEALSDLDSGICRRSVRESKALEFFRFILKHPLEGRAACQNDSGKSSCGTLRVVSSASNFAGFWPEYVRAHSQPATRAMHLAGTLLGWALFLTAFALRRWWWVAGALVFSYALAWVSHFFVEHNRPATFEHPLWSWRADQKMVLLMLAGKMNEEVRRCNSPQI